MSYRVRAWGRRHARDVSRLVTEAAKLMGDPDVKTTPERLLADGFGPRPKFGCLVAEAAGEEGRAVGVLLHHFSYCTWTGRVLYGEELYVEPPHRGRGIGRALVENAAKVALAHGCSQLRVLAPGGPGGALGAPHPPGGHRCHRRTRLGRVARAPPRHGRPGRDPPAVTPPKPAGTLPKCGDPPNLLAPPPPAGTPPTCRDPPPMNGIK